VKIYAAAVEALSKKERAGSKQYETQFTTKEWCISEFHPGPLKANVVFCI
jgi:hypothetical protein